MTFKQFHENMSFSKKFIERDVSKQELAEALSSDVDKNNELYNELLGQFTIACKCDDNSYTLKYGQSWMVLAAENAKRGNYPIQLNDDKEYNIIAVTNLYRPGPFPIDKPVQNFAGAVITVEEV
jgi:hypothetical protein